VLFQNCNEAGESSVVEPTINYQVKVINPQNMGGYVVEQWTSKKFDSRKDIENALSSPFSESIGSNSFQFGIILPGHGFKGKQVLISDDNDVKKLYLTYSAKAAVRLWLKCAKGVEETVTVRPQKRSRADDSEDYSSSKARCTAGPGYSSHMKRMDKVEEIYEELYDQHSDKYTAEQIRAWAHMIHMKKHTSYESAPNKPFFRIKQENKMAGVSPGKRIDLRSKCIDQLEKWHTLLDRGAISNQEYDDFTRPY